MGTPEFAVESLKRLVEGGYNVVAVITMPDKPMIVSEFGAGGIYGFRDRTRVKWSEERQADILVISAKK